MDEFRQRLPVVILRGIGNKEMRIRSGVNVVEGTVLHHAEPAVSGNLEAGTVGSAEAMDGAGSAAAARSH